MMPRHTVMIECVSMHLLMCVSCSQECSVFLSTCGCGIENVCVYLCACVFAGQYAVSAVGYCRTVILPY